MPSGWQVKLQVPYIELDEIHWKPNWTASTDEELFSKLTAALAGDQWVLDGNYHRTARVKWQRVQMVIWLDLPYWLILYQVITRTFRRSLRREVLWAGNTESLFKAFFRCDSIILWSLTNLQRVRQQYVREMSDPVNEHIRFVRLRSRGEMNGFLLDIEEAVSAGQAWQ